MDLGRRGCVARQLEVRWKDARHEATGQIAEDESSLVDRLAPQLDLAGFGVVAAIEVTRNVDCL